MTIKTLDAFTFTDTEQTIIISAVSLFGKGQHPEATRESLPFFGRVYVAKCLARAVPTMSAPYNQTAHDIIARLLRGGR